jgi:death-on-curing protein
MTYSSFIDYHLSSTAVATACATSRLLESALAQPMVAFGEQYAHDTVYAMAAAYLFHIAANHPFIDGNKRTALLAALVFLDINGISVEHSSEQLYELTIGIADGRIDKQQAIVDLQWIATRGASADP